MQVVVWLLGDGQERRALVHLPSPDLSGAVLDELRAVPPVFAGILVLGARVVTVAVLSGTDALAGDGTSSTSRQVVTKRPQHQMSPPAVPDHSAARGANRQAQKASPEVAQLVGQRLMVGVFGENPSPALLDDV